MSERPHSAPAVHDGEMSPNIAYNARLSGLEIASPHWMDFDDAEGDAQIVMGSLWDDACEYSGEVIARIDHLEITHEWSYERVVAAITELERYGVLLGFSTYLSDEDKPYVFATFNMDFAAHYGSDQTPEPDFLPESASCDNAEPHDDYEDDGWDFRPSADVDERRQRIYAKTRGRCFYCVRVPAEQLDHMHPKSRGGSDDDENMIGACTKCNIRKLDRTVEEYRAYLAHRQKLERGYRIVFFDERHVQ